MSALSYLGPVMESWASCLAGRDSRLLRAYLSCARAATNSFRYAYPASFSPLADAPIQVLNAEPSCRGFCHPPKSFESEIGTRRQLTFPAVQVAALEDQFVEACSSFPYDAQSNCFYVNELFLRSRRYASNAGGHLGAHGANAAIVHRNYAKAVIPRGIFLGGNGSFNYYHWLVEIVSKLRFLCSLPHDMEEWPLLVNERASTIPSFAEILRVLSPGRKLVYLEEGKSYLVRSVVLLPGLVEAPFNLRGRNKFAAEDFITRPCAISYLRTALGMREDWFGDRPWPERVYLARGAQRSYNQQELTAIAEANGFKVIFPERHTFREQVAYFSKARTIVGPSGAAWSNLIFADPQCRALCWMPEELGEFAAFSNIAGIIGADLRYLFYKSGVRRMSDVYRHSYRISPEAFRSALAHVL